MWERERETDRERRVCVRERIQEWKREGIQVWERETGVREKERDRGGRERKIKEIQGGKEKDRTRDRGGTKRERER